MIEIDPIAKYDAEKRFALPPSLHLPVAARDKESITRFIGVIVSELSKPNTDNAFLVSVTKPDIDLRLPIWKLETSHTLHRELQVWVHVNYNHYRKAYKKAFPKENIDALVLNHILNRRSAVIRGFNYLRIVPVSRAVNSSSAFSESWAVAESHSLQRGNIKYADLPDIVTMLNIMPGGGVMDAVNEAQKLYEL